MKAALMSVALAVCMGVGVCSAATRQGRPFALKQGRLSLEIPVEGLKETVRFAVAGDTHLALHDERDAAYADNYRRMAQYPGSTNALPRVFGRARKEKADLVAFVGDIISFPTLANVEHVVRAFSAGGVDWTYTAGNHDWHFEGDADSDAEQRERWIARRLRPLYRGKDPLMHACVVKGVRFVSIDNSEYHVTPEQLDCWLREAEKGEPVVLLMHVPLWTDGWGKMTCGSPEWGAKTDPYWQIERRQRWAERQSESTFAFRRAVLATPNLVGVFTGHHHDLMAAQAEGQLMFSVPSSRQGDALMVSLVPAKR